MHTKLWERIYGDFIVYLSKSCRYVVVELFMPALVIWYYLATNPIGANLQNSHLGLYPLHKVVCKSVASAFYSLFKPMYILVIFIHRARPPLLDGARFSSLPGS